MTQPTPEDPVEILKSAHAAFNEGDIETALGLFDEDIEWTRPAVGTVQGRTAVLEEIFLPLAELLEEHEADYHIEVDTYLSEGEEVAAFGRGILSKDDETVELPFAQHWQVVDGKLLSAQNYRDPAEFNEFLGINA